MTEEHYTPPIPRATIEEAIEHAIAFLDLLDGDPDREPNGDDEPALGWTEMEERWGRYSALACSDLEEQCEDEGAEHDGREPDVDDEPDYHAPPAGYVGYNPLNGQPIIEDRP